MKKKCASNKRNRRTNDALLFECFLRDVQPVLRTVEADRGAAGGRCVRRSLLQVAVQHDGDQHPATVRDELSALVPGHSRMEHEMLRACSNSVKSCVVGKVHQLLSVDAQLKKGKLCIPHTHTQTCDNAALGGCFWVALAGHDYTDRAQPGPELEIDLVQPIVAGRLHHLVQIALEQWQDDLCLRIAEPAVEFERFWPVRSEHHASVQNTCRKGSII